MRHIQRSEYGGLAAAKIPFSALQAVEGYLLFYLEYILEARVNSIQFLRKIRKF